MSYISQKYNIPPQTVAQMAKDGILDWRINYYHEFWEFYNELLDYNYQNGVKHPRAEAREEVMLHFKINSERNFYRWLKACKRFFAYDLSPE